MFFRLLHIVSIRMLNATLLLSLTSISLKHIIMCIIVITHIFLAIQKKYELTLLLSLGFGACLENILILLSVERFSIIN